MGMFTQVQLTFLKSLLFVGYYSMKFLLIGTKLLLIGTKLLHVQTKVLLAGSLQL